LWLSAAVVVVVVVVVVMVVVVAVVVFVVVVAAAAAVVEVYRAINNYHLIQFPPCCQPTVLQVKEVEANGVAQPPQQRVCMYYKKSVCKNGDKCLFLHEDPPMRVRALLRPAWAHLLMIQLLRSRLGCMPLPGIDLI
jgi:hypothetical protein